MSFDGELAIYVERYKDFLRANGGRKPFDIVHMPLFTERCQLLGNTPAGDRLNQLWRAERQAESEVAEEVKGGKTEGTKTMA